MTSGDANNLQEIEAKTLKQWLNDQQVILIDVREQDEYASERIAEATLMPLSQFNPTEVKPIPGKNIVLSCKSGNRSKKAAQKLFEAGFETVIHLKGGLTGWKEAGYETEVNENASA